MGKDRYDINALRQELLRIDTAINGLGVEAAEAAFKAKEAQLDALKELLAEFHRSRDQIHQERITLMVGLDLSCLGFRWWLENYHILFDT